MSRLFPYFWLFAGFGLSPVWLHLIFTWPNPFAPWMFLVTLSATGITLAISWLAHERARFLSHDLDLVEAYVKAHESVREAAAGDRVVIGMIETKFDAAKIPARYVVPLRGTHRVIAFVNVKRTSAGPEFVLTCVTPDPPDRACPAASAK